MEKMRFFSLLLTAVILLSSCGGAGTSDGTADSSAVANGTTELGTLAVKSTVFVPTVALPFFVMQRMVTVPLVAFGMLSASESGTVHA